MKNSLITFLAESIFTLVIWSALIVFAILWPLTFLYLRFISKKPVSDQVSSIASSIIKFNTFIDDLLDGKSWSVMRVNIEDVIKNVDQRSKWNNVPLNKMIFVYNGEDVVVSTNVLEAWSFTGLSNVDFIREFDWKNPVIAGDSLLKTLSEKK